MGCPGFWKQYCPVVENSALEPGVDEAGDRAEGVEFSFECWMRDAFEAFGDVGVQDVFRFETREVENRFECVVRRTSGAEAVGVRFEACLPFRFEGEFDESL